MILDNAEIAILSRDKKVHSEWEVISNNFLPEGKSSEGEIEQHKICDELLSKSAKIAIEQHGLSPEVFYDALIIHIRMGKVVASYYPEDDKMVSYDKPDDKVK